MAIKAGMSIAEAILQLTRGFRKIMGRDPDGLEKIKIQQEAVERLKNLEKVVDMRGNVIDTSKGIMGGRQIQDNKEFGEALKKALMEKDNPYSDLVKTTQKGPKTLQQRRKEAEEALKNKNVKPIRESLEDFVDDAGGVNPDDPRGIDDFIPDPEDMAQGGRAGFSKGKIVKEGLEGLAQLLKKEKARTQRISGNLRLENMQRTKVGKPKEGVDYDYYRELLDDDENFIVMGDETKEFLEAMVKEQKAEMDYMFRLYKKGALNPTAGETTMGRLKMLEDKAQSGKDLSVDEIAEIKKLSEIFNKAQGGRAGFADGSPIDPMDPTNKLNEVLNAFRKLSRRSQNKIGFRKFFETYAEENFATGGRAGFANGSEGLMSLADKQKESLNPGAPSIVLNPEERKMEKVFETDKVEDAIKEIIKRSIGPLDMAEIPISKKGKLRFGFDSSGNRQLTGGLGLLGGELNIGMGSGRQGKGMGFEFRKRFEKGGMSRRKFMKIMGGIATLPILGKYIKPAMPLIKKGAEITGPALDKIIETVMSAGKLISQSGKRLKELTTKKKLKDVEVEEDIMDGPSYTIKTKDKTIYYRPGRQDEMGIDDDIIEVIEDKITKKAGGGIARMLGE